MDENKNRRSKTKKKSVKSDKKSVKVLKIIGTIVLSMFLVVVITGAIFGTALTIYVLNFADTTTTVSLENVSANYTSRFLYENPDYNENDPDSEQYELYYALKNSNQHAVWCDYSSIPQCLVDAVVNTEDERFTSHDGVDFKRTLASFVNVFIPIYSVNSGGSTITQQTIKNITGDNARSGSEGAERKIREIFRAINVEKQYSKEEILQCYLNIISLNTYEYDIIGVQAAANYYFGKDVSQIGLAESAMLAAMIQSPAAINPEEDRTANAERATYVLGKMLENGAISSGEYDQAIEDLPNVEITCDITYSSVSQYDDETKDQGPTSWFMDDCIEQAIDIIMDTYGISLEDASDKLYSGGFTIYTTVDKKMQDTVETNMLNNSNFQSYSFDDDELYGAFVAMDYSGNVKAIVGSRKEKTESRIFNYASDGVRSPGSTIKPISAYGPAIDANLVTYSTLLKDEPITITDEDGNNKKWPVNYSDSDYENWTYNSYPLWTMLQNSTNTAAAQLVKMLTPSYSYNFLQQKLGITTMDLADADYSAMSVGGFTNGLHLSELVAAYQIFGNGGKMYETTYISSMVDKDGTEIYVHSDNYTQAVSANAAYVTNRAMQKVITSGTGTAAKLSTTDLVGKTGTTENWTDLLFVGCTPDYVSGVWIGYDTLKTIPTGQYQNSAKIWYNIFGTIAENETTKEFKEPEGVVKANYCTQSGLLASNSCSSTAVGYYKEDNVPGYCSLGY